jgi:hypothetical protein
MTGSQLTVESNTLTATSSQLTVKNSSLTIEKAVSKNLCKPLLIFTAKERQEAAKYRRAFYRLTSLQNSA